LLQGLLSRGGREVGELLPELAAEIRYPQACRNRLVDSKLILHRERGESEVFPWEVIDCRVDRDYLWHEWHKSADYTV
jgi:hypothetical protein